MTYLNIPTLVSSRLSLRPINAKDVDAIFAIFSDSRVMRYWSTPAHSSTAEAMLLIDKAQAGYQSEQMILFGIERHDTEQLIGTCTLHARNHVSRRGELGYALGADHWGHGYMNEALERFLQFVFVELDLNRLEADIDPRNESSARTLERLGFIREGYAKERWIVSGELSDTAWYGLLARHWRERVSPLKATL